MEKMAAVTAFFSSVFIHFVLGSTFEGKKGSTTESAARYTWVRVGSGGAAMKAMHPHPLRLARCQHNLTINQLAEEARVGASTIWRAEHAYPISAESRRRLCAFFDLTSQELGLVSDRREKLDQTQEADQVFIAPSPHRSAGDAAFGEARIAESHPASVLLAHTSSDLAALLDAGWSLNAIFTALRPVLQGVQAVPTHLRRSMYEIGFEAIKGSNVHITAEHLSHEERTRLGDGLRKSVAESWRLYQSSPPAYVIVVAQTQLALVQQTYALLPAALRSSLYAALYNLIGAALLSQGHYAAARRTHEKAHIAALEGADIWNMAQSLNWQAIGASNTGHYEIAIQCIQAALRLLGYGDHETYTRLKAHLLADWAYNAALLHEQTSVDEKLEASAALLEGLGPDEEFDLSRWHQTAGGCMLLARNYSMAISYLEQSLGALAPHWLVRRALTLFPLAEAYALQQERDASIAIGEQAVHILQKMDSTMLNHCFSKLEHKMLRTFPEDRRVRAFIESAHDQPLLHASRNGQSHEANEGRR
jgi:tetratricopeptide (TPR) repeat protein